MVKVKAKAGSAKPMSSKRPRIDLDVSDGEASGGEESTKIEGVLQSNLQMIIEKLDKILEASDKTKEQIGGLDEKMVESKAKGMAELKGKFEEVLKAVGDETTSNAKAWGECVRSVESIERCLEKKAEEKTTVDAGEQISGMQKLQDVSANVDKVLEKMDNLDGEVKKTATVIRDEIAGAVRSIVDRSRENFNALGEWFQETEPAWRK